jgi:hypothetical protein
MSFEHENPRPTNDAPADSVDHGDAVRALENGLRRALDAHEAYQGKHRRDSDRNYTMTLVATAVGFLVFVATAYQAYLTQDAVKEASRAANAGAEQARIASDALAEAKKSGAETADMAMKSLRISQRAYIAPRVPRLDLKAGLVYVTIDNTGRVPARSIRAGTVEIRTSGNTIRKLSTEVFTSVPQGLFPNNPINLKIQLVELTAGEAEFIKVGAVRLAVAGYIAYDDGFGIEDTSGFCWIYDYAKENHWDVCK